MKKWIKAESLAFMIIALAAIAWCVVFSVKDMLGIRTQEEKIHDKVMERMAEGDPDFTGEEFSAPSREHP